MGNKKAHESGFVSIFTVLFFIVFIMVITIGFIRVVGQEQQQANDNSTAASALAAARSGVEDGKRALLLYNTTTDPSLRAALEAAFDSQSCGALFKTPAIANALDLSADGGVANTSGLDQSYTCLTVQRQTDDVTAKLLKDKSDIVPLRSTGDVSNFTLEWHGTSNNLDRQPSNYANGSALLSESAWNTRGNPALMRVQVIAVPKGNYTIDQIQSETQFLVPASGGSTTVAVSGSLSLAACSGTPGAVTEAYACRTTLSSPLINNSNDVYLRLTPMYRDTNIRLTLADGGGAALRFDNVEPIVDVTGKTGFSFRRLQSRVRLDGTPQLPEYVVETGNNLCKAFTLTDTQVYPDATCPTPGN